MPEFDGLTGLENPTYTAPEKKGAPQVEAPVLDGLEAPTWNAGTQTKLGAPQVEEPVLLDDPAPAWQAEKKGAPQIEAPVLDDMPVNAAPKTTTAPLPSAADLQADILGDSGAYDPVEEFYGKMQFTPELKTAFAGLDAEKQVQVVEMRAKQMGIPVPPIPRELRPKLEAPAPSEGDAPQDVVLEEAPKPQAYVPKFKDEDLERAKEESKKPQKYTPPVQEMTEEKRRENVRIMNQLREERERESAKKGQRLLIVLSILGVIAGVAFTLFISGAFGAGYKMEEELGLLKFAKEYGMYVGVVAAAGSLMLALPLPAIRSFMKFIHGLSFVLMLFPGIPLLIQKEAGHGLLNGLLYAAALLLSGACCFVMTTSEHISMYDKYGNS